MAISVGDILMISDVQTYLEQQMLNVYFYRVLSADVDADLENVAQAFELQVATEVAVVQHEGVSHPWIIVRNLTDGISIWEEPTTIIGTNAGGSAEPSFTALGFRLNRSTAATRHGSKRIGGVPDSVIVGNGVASGTVTTLNDIATAMASNISIDAGAGVDFEAEPVIVGRVPIGQPNAGQLDLTTINPVASAQFVRPTTQNTRKLGRGA